MCLLKLVIDFFINNNLSRRIAIQHTSFIVQHIDFNSRILSRSIELTTLNWKISRFPYGLANKVADRDRR